MNIKKITALTLVAASLASISVFAATSDVSIKDRIDALMEEGYERSEIKDILEDEGYEFDGEGRGQKGEKGDRGTKGAKLDLDDETQAAIDEMKEDGATREEIMAYLEEQGIELPEKPERAEGEEGRGGKGMKLDLDEDTQAAIDEMKEDGASREEIMEYLDEAGYEIPEKPEGGEGRGGKGGKGSDSSDSEAL